MTPRWNVRGPEFRLSLMVFAVSLSNLAMAQPGDTAGATAAASSTEAATATTTAPTASASASAAAEAAPAPAATPANPAPGAVTPPEEATGPGAAKQPIAHEEAEPTPPAGVPLNVEILPGSGYPQPRIRGLVGGSLWFVMPGYQFPYLAPETSKNGTRIAVSGYVWNDTSFARITTKKQGGPKNLTRWNAQGVGMVRITPSYTTREGWFGMGNVELVGNIEQSVTSGDIGTLYDTWVRAGKWNVFDVTVGRFQGWEVYHYGMGLDYNTYERTGASLPGLAATQIYGVSTYWDRPRFGVSDYAVHLYPTDYLRFEVLGQIGQSNGTNVQATRPVAILDFGFVKVKAGWEYGVAHNQQDGNKGRSRDNGFGGAVQFVWNPYLEGGINGAIGYHDEWIDTGKPKPESSTTTSTFGGFLNGRVYGPLMLGVGANQTHWNNLLPNGNSQTPQLHGKTDNADHFQGFGAIQYSFWDKLFIKFVANYAKFEYHDVVQVPAHPWNNKEYGGRLRVQYLF